MNPFDELPRRDQNHEIEDQALAAFQKRLADSSEGAHWNSGDQAKAKEVWSIACERFPEHELVSQVRTLSP